MASYLRKMKLEISVILILGVNRMKNCLSPLGKALMTAAALAALAAPLTSSAALVTRQFEFSSTSGPLTFGPTIGSFTYDDIVAPVGGGTVSQLSLFSDLSVSFGGYSFDETSANSGWLVFDSLGGLLEALFGTSCSAGVCGIGGGEEGWWIRVGVPDTTNDFAYSGYNGATGFYQTFSNRLLENAVPEPAPLALIALGMVGLGLARRKRVSA